MLKKAPFQKGFTLIELAIVIAISTMMAGILLWENTVKLNMAKGAAQGTQLATASNGVATYATTYYSQLVNNQAVAGYVNIYAPTIAELRTAGWLPANFNATNLYGSGYGVIISKMPAACAPPACDIVSMTNLTGPITNPLTGRVDGAQLGSAASTIGADSGYSTLTSSASITGVGGAWAVANPAGNVAGILGVRAGYGSSGWAQFLRRDGQLPMTGNLNMGNQNLNNANTLNSVTIANSGNASVTGNTAIGGTLGVTGQTSTNGIANAGTLTTGNTTITGTANISGNTTINGNTAMGGTLAVSGLTTAAGITNIGTIANTGNITNTGDVSTGRIWLKTIVANGASCAGFTGYQASTAAGSIASCINGLWTTPNAATAPPPPCSSQSLTWGVTSGCYATFPASASGQSATMSASAPNGGSATFVCNAGAWSLQSGSCSMTCTAQTLTWGAGCQSSFTAASGGTSQTKSATNSPYTGSGTFVCNNTNGAWNFSSGSCTAPSPCSGSASWGNGNCTATYSLSSGQSTTLSSSGSNTYAGYNLGGSVNGSANASCNNGAITISGKSCNYSGSYPLAYNNAGGGSAPNTTYIVSDAAAPYCSALLGSGTSSSYATTPCPNDNAWFNWVGRVTTMGWNEMVAGGGNSASGASCYAWRTNHPTAAFIVNSLTCTNNN